MKRQETLSLSKTIISEPLTITQKELYLTIEDTFNQPKMREVFKGDKSPIGFSVVSVLIKRFLNSFAFATKISPVQTDILTADAMVKFEYETLEDVVLFLKLARSGTFGTAKKGIDSNLLFGDWFPQYLEQKAIVREQHKSKKVIDNSELEASVSKVLKAYKEAAQRKAKAHQTEIVKNYIDKITANYDRQMLEDLITDWEKDKIRKPYVRLLKLKRKTIK